jgi:hypothetical protein
MAAVDPVDRAVAVALVAMQPPHHTARKVVEPHLLINPRNDCACVAVYSFHKAIVETTPDIHIEAQTPSNEIVLLIKTWPRLGAA